MSAIRLLIQITLRMTFWSFVVSFVLVAIGGAILEAYGHFFLREGDLTVALTFREPRSEEIPFILFLLVISLALGGILGFWTGAVAGAVCGLVAWIIYIVYVDQQGKFGDFQKANYILGVVTATVTTFVIFSDATVSFPVYAVMISLSIVSVVYANYRIMKWLNPQTFMPKSAS